MNKTSNNLTIFDISNNVKKEHIYESNHLIQATYKLSILEQKVIHFLFSLINKNDKEFKTFKFKAKDLVSELKLNSNNYKTVRDTITSLKNKNLKIFKKETNSLLELNWLSSAEYYFNTGIIELEISEKLKPYLLDLQKEFTQYSYKIIQSFDSQYSPRFYKLLKQYYTIWSRTFELEDLKNKLMIDSGYEKYGHFKNKILKQVEKELQAKSDIYFKLDDVEEIKRGKKVVGIKIFILNPKDNTIENLDANELEKEWLSPEEIDIFDTLKQLFIVEYNDKDLIKILKGNSIDKVSLAIKILEKYLKKWTVKNRKEYFSQLLKTENLSDNFIELKEKETVNKQKTKEEEKKEAEKKATQKNNRDRFKEWFHSLSPETQEELIEKYKKPKDIYNKIELIKARISTDFKAWKFTQLEW